MARLTAVHRALILLFCLSAVTAPAQAPSSNDGSAPSLRALWSETCARLQAGVAWSEVTKNLEAGLAAATADDETRAEIERALAAIRASHQQAADLPEPRLDATPDELVAHLINTQILNAGNGWHLLYRPHRYYAGTDETVWQRLADVPDHEGLDPVLRLFMRGRDAVPKLIETLDDMAATRTVYEARGRRSLTHVLRRCDFAMGLLEAITRCKFFDPARDPFFSQQEESARTAARQLAADWWQHTQAMTRHEAREWLLQRVEYDQASSMISLLEAEGRIGVATQHLRRYLLGPDGKVRIKVVQRLASHGDQTGVQRVLREVRESGTIDRTQAEVVVAYGDRRAYELLAELVTADIRDPDGDHNRPSTTVLRALANTDNRLAIPVLATALNPDDRVQVGRSFPSQVELPDTHGTRADLAAAMIQHLSGRDFRYNPHAERSLRGKAIARVRDWWDSQGRGIYGFETIELRRTGGIR